MSTQNRHSYKPLPHASGYLRVLTLHAGNVLEPIRCTLQTVSLDEKPPYDALSYTWGDPTATKSIEVDGVSIHVTSNLEQALRHMRDRKADLVLWVDAICINQLDATEKSHQVALMGRIYSECAQVRIWLGCDTMQCRLVRSSSPSSNETDDDLVGVDPFTIIRMLANDQHIHEWPCFQTQDDSEPRAVVYKPDDNFSMMWEGFLAVIQSPWWTRMWTVQETILPRAGRLHLDTWTTSLQTITNCGQCYYNRLWEQCCQNAISQLPHIIKTAMTEFGVVAGSFDEDRARDDEGNLLHDNLHGQHLAYGFRVCEDPRDKVYALLGIIDDQFLTPNYIMSEEEVFFQATYRMLCREDGTLNSLTGPQCGPKTGKWATWVRDFDAPLTRMDADIAYTRYALCNYDFFDASDGHKSAPALLRALPRSADELAKQVGLKIVGRRVRKVTAVYGHMKTQFPNEMAGSQRQILRQWILEALNWDAVDMSTHANALSDVCTNSDNVMRFWRTLLGGIDISHSIEEGGSGLVRFRSVTMHRIVDFLTWLEESGALGNELERLLAAATHGRCYFKAENDNQGLCYPNTCVGDEIWVLDGGRVPFILRRAHLNQEEREALRPVDVEDFGGDESDGSGGNFQWEKSIEGYYELIGDCYFDGYMHGEAVRDSTLSAQSIVLV
jgi:hypothetical protein